MSRVTGFLADGWYRARAALWPVLYREVELQFAERLATAGWLERRAIRREIRAKVEERVKVQAPADALY